MTNPTQPKAIPNPAVLIYGKPTSPDLPQASWFRVEDRPVVIAAAQSLKFSVLDIRTDAEKALTLGVHEGVLKGNGRMIVGSVTPEVYKRIEEHAAKASPGGAAKAASDVATGTKPGSEQNTNLGERGTPAPPTGKPAPTAPDGKAEATTAVTTAMAPNDSNPAPAPARDAWDALRIGSHVLVKYWEADGQPIGWWVAVIADIDKSGFVIRWPDEPTLPAMKTERKHVAILHPSFDVTREWDRRR